jgi:alpha-L-fucosidase
MAATAQTFPDIKPAPQQTQWQDLEFGVILHFGTNTFPNREWGDGPPVQKSSIRSSSILDSG